MKLSGKKSAPKKSPFMAINKQGLKEVKGGIVVVEVVEGDT